MYSYSFWKTVFLCCNHSLHNLYFNILDVDFVTPLCSQVVYEGLVDDIFRIKCGKQFHITGSLS